MIRTNRLCRFTDGCSACLKQRACISATRITNEKRKFVLSLRNSPIWSLETKEKFKGGTALHEAYQKDIPALEDYGYIKYREDLYKHNRIKLSELSVCSSLYGMHGIIDSIVIEYTKDNDLNIWVEELKSHKRKEHYMQIACYVTILSDLNCRLAYKVPLKRKKKFKKILGFFYPDKIRNVNIKARVFQFNYDKEQPFMEAIAGNKFVESFGNMKLALLKRYKDYSTIMIQCSVDAERIKYCKRCNKRMDAYCGWVELCSKIGYLPKEHQLYDGKKNLLIKTKVKR